MAKRAKRNSEKIVVRLFSCFEISAEGSVSVAAGVLIVLVAFGGRGFGWW